MANRRFHKNRFNKTNLNNAQRIILIRERKLIEKHYDFIEFKISRNKLICSGSSQPTDQSIIYKFVIVYDGLSSPKVNVLEPDIEYNDEIHMFPKDKSLCLYHSKTDNLTWDFRKHSIYNTIIPWTIEWFVYYELYNITGKWEHPYIDHRLQSIKSMNVDLS